MSVLVLYVGQILALPTAAYGLMMAVGAVGGLAGGFAAARIVRASGPAIALASSLVVAAAGQAILGLTTVAPVAAVGLAVGSFAFGVWNVASVTQRQTLTPPDLLGRVTSTARTITMTASLTGALIGGLIASQLGLRAPVLLGVPLLLLGAPVCYAALRTRD